MVPQSAATEPGATPGDPPGNRRYRPEIDGLRALAVLPVMLFHAGFTAFGGGYIGVDVFFVISGFLITGIIADDRARRGFSLLRFYERRARRILPALFIVAATCIPFALWTMVPEELANFGKSLVAVALFVSNVLFWRTSGYFDLAATERPLLHTWSLGIEEQFYVFFPLALVALWSLGRRPLALTLAALAVASLAASEILLHRDAVASFYLLPTRAWELLAGAAVAVAGPRAGDGPSPRAREALASVALALIVVPIFVYDAATPFPGLAAVPPVAGTMLLLAVPPRGTVAGRLLTLRPMLGVGAISYSAYLWHQPLFAFARLVTVGIPSPGVFAGLIAGALVLAALSLRFVEQPFRTPGRVSRAAIFTGAVAGSLALAAAGGAMVVGGGLPARFSPAALPFVMPAKTTIDGCPAADAWLNVCRLGAPGVAPTIALVGDSHAYALGSELDAALRRQGRAGVLVHTDCHPIAGVFDSRTALTPARVTFCGEAGRRLIAYIAQPAIRGVIVAVRWNLRLFPLDGGIDAPTFDNGEGGIEATAFRTNLTIDAAGRASPAAAVKVAATTAYVRALAGHAPTVLVYPVPEVGWTPTRLNAVAIARGNGPLPTISTSWDLIRRRTATVTAMLDRITAPNLRRVYPERIFCNTFVPGRCAAQANGTLYYFDDNHLAAAGARPVVAAALSVLGD